MNVGDIIKLKPRFEDLGDYAIVIDISKAEYFGDGGWISFDYTIMTNNGSIYRISSDCAEEVYPLFESSLNERISF